MHDEHRLPRALEAPAHSRRLVAESLRDHPRLQDIVLAASELVANAVAHGKDATDLTLGIVDRDGTVRLWVEHTGSTFDPHVERDFHGLGFVERLSDRWGIDEGPGTVTVWFELDPPAA